MEITQSVESLKEKIQILEGQLAKLSSRLKDDYRCPKCERRLNGDFGNLKPSEAIVACLREMDRPVGVGFLRQKLESKGYPMNRFGRRFSYFYTLICRLDGKKIQRLEGDEIMLVG